MQPMANRNFIIASLLTVLAQPQVFAWEDKPEEQARVADAATGIVSEGLLRAMMKRTAYEMSGQLEMDEVQEAELLRTLNDRWLPFYRKHRRRIDPIVDRMMQARWDPDLPSAEEAQAWAEQTMQFHELFSEEVDMSNQEIAKLLKPDQVEQFEENIAQFKMGLDMFKIELQKMEQGKLADTMWAHSKVRRNARHERRRRKQEEELARKVLASAELTAVSVDVWDKYVAGIVAKFGLDEAQKASASGILDDVKVRATQYVHGHKDDLSAIRQELIDTQDEQRAEIITKQKELLGPLQTLFAELKSRLDKIPTEAQRAAVAAEAQPKPAVDG